MVILITLIAPYIDANFFYYSRLEHRINNLSALVELSGKDLEETPTLLEEYNSILAEISQAQEKNIFLHNSKNDSSEKLIKFISGILLFAVVGLVCLLNKNGFNKTFLKNNLLVAVFCWIFAIIFGMIFMIIPTFGNVWIHAVLTPFAQILILYLLFGEKTKNE